MDHSIRIGVIGGSGVYQMEALTDVQEIVLETPFGSPSDSYLVGKLEGQPVAFLARHGRGHRISPTPRQLPRQCLRLQTVGGRVPDRRQRLRQPPGTHCAGPHRGSGPALRPHYGAADQLLRRPGGRHRRPRGPRERGRSFLPVAERRGVPGRQRGGRRGAPGRQLRDRSGAALQHQGREPRLPRLGHGHHRHDHQPRGVPGPRGGDELRGDGPRDGLRRVARSRKSR